MNRLRIFTVTALAAVLGVGAAQPAPSPAGVCRVPAEVAPAPELTPPAAEVVSDVPTAFYMLAITWSPEWCRERTGDAAYAFQCEQNDFGFVLHGLWPNGAGKRHPRFCGPARPLDTATVRKYVCMIPSAEMLQHEWAAHGTCGWSDPKAYYRQAAKLWTAIDAPDLTAPTMTGKQIRDRFVAANPKIPREGVYLRVVSGNYLQDIRVCYDLKYRPAACPGGVGAPDEANIRVAPRKAG
jgi:ribonuclease T2